MRLQKTTIPKTPLAQEHLRALQKLGYIYSTLAPLYDAENRLKEYSLQYKIGAASQKEYIAYREVIWDTVADMFNDTLPENFYLADERAPYMLCIKAIPDEELPIVFKGAYSHDGILCPSWEILDKMLQSVIY